MKGTRVEIRPLTGLHQEVPAPPQSASKIENFTVDQRTQGWDNRLGYEKYLVDPAKLYEPFQSLSRIDSLYVWPRHAGALEYVVFESGGGLYVVNDWTSPVTIRALATARNVPTPAEVPTTYTPFGRWLVMLNGHEAPVRYSGWDTNFAGSAQPIYPLGWLEAPAPPTPWDVDVDPSTHTADIGQLIGIWAEGSGEYGLGSSTGDAPNGYRWRMTCLSNAGGESPISAPSGVVEWQTPSSGDFQFDRFIVGMEVPVGPPGTIARNIYRTKNLGDNDLGSGEDQLYYYVTTIRNNHETYFYDHWSDNQLGSEAPGSADSVPLPALTARYSAVFKGCLFTDGGSAAGTKVYWSLPGKLDQFTALDFSDVGTRTGGEVTGFYSHYNYLLIFRDQAVDILYGTYPNFEIRPLMQGVGTRAVQTARTIPDLNGVVFLATDGVYLVSGSVDGGGTIEAKKISVPVQDEVNRSNIDVSARAVAEYSAKWREYHCYFAADGEDRPTLGIVYHVDKQTWSTRVGFPVGCISVNANGDLVFGHNEGFNGIKDNPAGLFVVTRRHSCGHDVVEVPQGPGQQEPTTETVFADPCPATYRSAWHDFGDPASKKKVLYLYLYAYTMGDDPVTVTVKKDYSSKGVDVPAIRLQRADWEDQDVYGTAKLGDAVWEENLVACFKVDVNSAFQQKDGQHGNSSSWWAWEVVTSADFVLFGYSLEYAEGGGNIIHAKRAT